jgi:hypothetical protein
MIPSQFNIYHLSSYHNQIKYPQIISKSYLFYIKQFKFKSYKSYKSLSLDLSLNDDKWQILFQTVLYVFG